TRIRPRCVHARRSHSRAVIPPRRARRAECSSMRCALRGAIRKLKRSRVGHTCTEPDLRTDLLLFGSLDEPAEKVLRGQPVRLIVHDYLVRGEMSGMRVKKLDEVVGRLPERSAMRVRGCYLGILSRHAA